MSARQRLEAALRLLGAESVDQALIALLEVWVETRSPSLATLIEQVSQRLSSRLPPVELSAHSSVAAAITARLEQSGPLDVGPLVDAITRAMTTIPGAYTLMVKLAARHPEDPRVATALHAIVLAPPFARTEGALYGDVVKALEATRDPRYLRDLVAWSARLEQRRRYIRKERRDLDVLRACAERAQKHLEQLPPLWVDEVLAGVVTSGAAAGPAKDEAALLAAIYADPSDVTKRLVYADVLTGRGDVRGEFITLQCTRDPDAKPSARERALLKDHGRAWLGPLDSGIRKQGLVYRRGFLAEARECSDDAQLRDPAWATIEAVELDARTWGERAVAFADREDLRALERLYLRAPDALLLRRERPRLKTLGLRSGSVDSAAVLASACFPGLEVLELEWRGKGVGEALLAALDGPLLRRRPVVRLTLDDPRDLFALAGRLPSVELIDGTGMSDDRSGWRLLFSGEKLEHLHVASSQRKYALWVQRVLQRLGRGTLTKVTADEGLPLRDWYGAQLDALGVTG